MKIFLATLIFTCFGLIGYAQSSFPLPKIQGQKNPLSSGASGKNYLGVPGTGGSSKSCQHNVSQSYRPDISVISIIPTLKLWLLPANFPNPFIKDDD
jgi:hypothetical protein